MRDPKEVLTEDGYEELRMHHRAMQNAIFFIINHADDLHIDEPMELLYKMQELLESKLLLKGDGEKDE